MLATTHWYDVVGALGAAVGGIAAAVGAIAAWRAASASRETSRDALEALALGIAPAVSVDFTLDITSDDQGRAVEPARWVAYMENESGFAAKDVSLEVRLRGGRTIKDSLERLGPRVMPPDPGWAASRHRVHLAEVPLPPAEPPIVGEQAVLRYSDEREIARYEQVYGFMSTTRGDGSLSATYGAMELGEPKRIR